SSTRPRAQRARDRLQATARHSRCAHALGNSTCARSPAVRRVVQPWHHALGRWPAGRSAAVARPVRAGRTGRSLCERPDAGSAYARPMIPRAALRLAAAVIAAQIACVPPAPHPNSALRSGTLTRSNVLLVTIDTLRADHVGSYGGRAP